MTQYFTDFSEYTTGVQPSDWTRRWVTTNWATTVVADAAASGGKVFQLNPSGVNARRLITWDLIDVDANRDAVEVYVKFKAVSTSDNLRECHALLRGSGSAASETGYRLGAAAATGTPFAVGKYVSGAFTSISSTNVTRADSEIWHMRGRANGTALKLRWWKDGDSEPVEWSDEQTDSDVSAAGWVGLFLFHGNTAAYVDVDIFSVGTNGDAASKVALPTGPTITNVPNMTIGVQATITGTGFGT